MKALLALLFFLVALASIHVHAGDEGYDLRGQHRAGLKYRDLYHYKISTTTNFQKGGAGVPEVTDLILDQDTVITVKSVEAGKVKEFTTQITKDEQTTIHHQGDKDAKSEEISDLSGHLIVSVRGQDGWEHTLGDGQPTPAQEAVLKTRSGWDDGEYVPAGKHPIGFSWEADPLPITNLLGVSCNAASGKVKMTFTSLKEVHGEKCGVIESTGSIKVKVPSFGRDLSGTMDFKFTLLTCLKTGLTVQIDAETDVKASGAEVTTEDKATMTDRVEMLE